MNRRFWSTSGLYLTLALCTAGGFWVHAQYVLSIAQVEAVAGLRSISVYDLIDSLPTAGLIAFMITWPLTCIVVTLVKSRIEQKYESRRLREDRLTFDRTQELIRTRDCIVFGLAKLAESRDRDTGNHLERISLYCSRLATAMQRSPRFQNHIDAAFIRRIGISSALHDIGKVGVKDAILLKPGRLTSGERLEMEQHTRLGAECIQAIERRLGSSNFLQMAREIAQYHHERWDGSGYPHGIAGTEIPLAARIVAIADVYDALSMQRVYKPAFPHEVCMQTIEEQAGMQFDPEIVAILMEIEGQFLEISSKFVDRETPAEPTQHFPIPAPITPAQEEVLLETIQLHEDVLDTRG